MLLDVTEKSSAGQTQQKLEILSRGNPSKFTYTPSLMNRGEIVEFEVYLSDSKDFNLTIDGKIQDGKFIKLGQLNEAIKKQAPLEMVALGFSNFFGFKWIAIVLCVLMFLGASIMAITAWEEDDPFEDVWNFVFFIISLLIIVFFLFLIILLFIY